MTTDAGVMLAILIGLVIFYHILMNNSKTRTAQKLEDAEAVLSSDKRLWGQYEIRQGHRESESSNILLKALLALGLIVLLVSQLQKNEKNTPNTPEEINSRSDSILEQ